MVGPRNTRNRGKASGNDPGGNPIIGSGATRRSALGLILGAPLLGACAGVQSSLNQFSSPFSSSQPPPGPTGPPGPQQQPLTVGAGGVKVGLVLPLSAQGNAGVAAQSMKN